jgi:hypothetical protein
MKKEPVLTDSGSRRLSFSLTGRAVGAVEDLSKKLCLPEGDVMRRALGLYETIVEAEQRGAKILIREADGETLAVRFVHSY